MRPYRHLARVLNGGLRGASHRHLAIPAAAIHRQPLRRIPLRCLASQATPPPPASQENKPTEDLLEVYRRLVGEGKLQWDDEQVRVITKLRHLLAVLHDYEPPLHLIHKLPSTSPTPTPRAESSSGGGATGWFGWKGKGRAVETEESRELMRVLSMEEELLNLKTPKGILITGPPGTGKSYLLSLFFDLLPTPHKRRFHYHAFTLSLYQKVFKEMTRRKALISNAMHTRNMENAAKRGWKAVFASGRWVGEDDAVEYPREETIPYTIAREMILDYHILYFDEMQLVDASSAALLRDVLSWYWRLGGVIVSCSNRVPDDLYHHGVQRDRMAGFLDALKSRCEVIELDNGRDFRQGEGRSRRSWYAPGDAGFEEEWRAASGGQAAPAYVHVYSRRVDVPLASGTVCRFSFADLCEQSLGPADYITLASTYRTFFIDEIPILLLKNKNEARRLINLVDALYESRCQLFVSAAAPPASLFFPDALGRSDADNEAIMAAEAVSEILNAQSRPNVSVYNPFSAPKQQRDDKMSSLSVLSIFTGEDERFAYKRAVSRLVEMTTSPSYAEETWIPLEHRAWETPAPSSTASHAQLSANPGGDDFAPEADYSSEQLGPRDNPPVISPHHVWGVADEWGPKAGKWGQGPKAHAAPGKGDGKA